MKKVFLAIFVLGSLSVISQREDQKDHTIGYHQIVYSEFQVNSHGLGVGIRRGGKPQCNIFRKIHLYDTPGHRMGGRHEAR